MYKTKNRGAGTMQKTISLGNQSFNKIRKNDYFYIDKTNFIKEWWENGDVVTLVTRPRRFGKTLNLSMTECFFSNQYAGSGNLFEGLSIWKYKEYQNMQGSYPVIFLSFAGIKADNYKAARDGIINIIIDLYIKYNFLLQGDGLDLQEKEYFSLISPGMTDSVIALSLHRLALCMERYYGKNVIILLDEYDTPLQEAYIYGFKEALLAGDLDYMNQFINDVSEEMFSSFDTGNKPSKKAQPERFYHGFVLGLIVDMAERYYIRSNRQSGLGRYDVMMQPKNNYDDAIIIEFKVFNPRKDKSLEDTVKNALEQISEKNYDAELLSSGITKDRIRHYGFAFKGKEVLIK
jgi:Protein of unknown function (DUF1703)./Predicted AAA-ATPase.